MQDERVVILTLLMRVVFCCKAINEYNSMFLTKLLDYNRGSSISIKDGKDLPFDLKDEGIPT
ncbi:MAG: hypothetical protein A2007_02120 [Verrucomicrobia bacterium GWC2_42_7]|nr:MAG: hypothetical protein A2007_02120 [Verrucomicrobia bacterium GWC2_42_7]